jgi:CubicO group peptidase (beta-lactamase class C family)
MSFSQLEQFIYDKMSETRLPSVSAAVIKDGEVAWAKSFGARSLETGMPASPKTLYCIGSVTKSFTVLAVMQLVEQGKLSLEDPIEKYLPFSVRPFGEPIKIWHFLSHSSGIPALGYAELAIRHQIGVTDQWMPFNSSGDMFTFMQKANDWVVTRPGERWFYLNEGYAMIGIVIEKVTGMAFDEYVKKNILEPIGMTRSGFRKEEMESIGDFATPYVTTQEGTRLPSSYPYGQIDAAGGLISSIEDMAEVVKMYLKNGLANGNQIVSAESIKNMRTPRVATPVKENPFGDGHYCLGLGVVPNFLGYQLVGHSGSVSVATAYMGFIPEKQVGAVVLVNGSGYAPSSMGMYGMAIALGKNPDDLPFVKKPLELANLAGSYENYKGTMKVQVKVAGDFLMVVSTSKYGTETVPLVPLREELGKKVFYTLSAGNKLEVEFLIKGDQVIMIQERYAFHRTGK